MGLIFNVTSGKNNKKRNNGLPKPVTRKVKKPDDLTTSALRFRSNILSKEICTSHSAFCQSRIKNVDSEYANSISSRRFRAKRKEKSSNLIAESQIKRRPLGFMIFNRSSVISENCTITRGKKIENCFPRVESDSLLSCNFDSSSDFTKSFQRRSEKYVMQAVMPIMKKYTGDNAHVSADAVSLEQATSALISNNPRLNCTHHKTKCRSSKPYRNLFRGTAVVAVGKATNRAKQMTVFPNIALVRKLSPTGSCAAEIISAQTLITSVTNRSVSPTSTVASVMPTLAGTLLDVPVFSQLWQKLVKLLGNSVAGITSPYRFSKEHVRSTLKTAGKTTKIPKAMDRLQKHSTISESILTGTATCSKITVSAIPTAPSDCSSSRTKSRLLPSVGTTSFFTLLTLICLETVLLSTVSNCAKTFYMHWNTSNSIFRIDNTDHIIDVNKGNLAFEFDQVHIICPVYEPGTFENETEKYIIYNVSKVEYETCRITNADPRVIAICDKPQKLMFFTITFRPFTPQPGGLEFLPGNDYYFISTSSKDDLYRRIGGRCSTNNMKVVFKVCCAPEEKNKTTTVTSSSIGTSLSGSSSAGGFGININSADGSGKTTSIENSANIDIVNTQANINQHMNSINTIGINGVNTGLMPIGGVNIGVSSGIGTNNGGMQMKPMNGASGTSINTNIDQFNRIPIQDGGVNAMGNNIGGLGGHGSGSIILTPGGHGGINMISSGGSIGIGQYPGHPGQTGIRINNVASQQHHATHKNNNYNGKDARTGGVGVSDGVSAGGGAFMNINFGDAKFLSPFVNTNHSNIVQSTINWPGWGRGGTVHSKNHNITTTTRNDHNINELNNNYYSPSHKPITNKTKNKNGQYDKHPNEAVKNEELTYNSGAMSIHPWPIWRAIGKAISTPICKMFSWLLNRCMTRTLKSSTAEFEMCSRCDKNQLRLETYMSPHVRSVFYRGEREFQPLLPGIVKFKYLILNYKKIITFLIGTISATIYILKVSVNTRADIYTAVKDNAPNLPNTVKIESNLRSSVKNAVVPHLVLDTLYSNVNEKLASIEFKYALVEPIIIGSMGLTFLSAQGTSANASASIYFASNAMQYFIDVRKADKSTSNIILLYLQLFNGYRSQIPSVSVKVKKFR